MSQKYVPLSEPELIFDHSGEAVASHLVLPNGVDTDMIELNVDRAARLSRWAGASQLHLAMAEGEPESYDVSGTNINADGTATFTGGRKRPKRSYADFTYDDTDNPVLECPAIAANVKNSPEFDPLIAFPYKASRLGVYVSKTAIEGSIKDEEAKYPRGLVDEKGWAKGLNAGIKEGVVKAATVRYSPGDIHAGIITGLNGLFKYWAVEDIADRRYFFPTIFMGAGLARRINERHISTLHGAASESYNPSLLPHCRLDRLAMTHLTSTTGNLVRVRK